MTMTFILSEIEADCSPDQAPDRVLDAFSPGIGSGPYQLLAPLHDLGLPGNAELFQRVLMTVGKPDDRGYAILIPLSWHVAGNPLFPAFKGSIEIAPLSSKRVQLSILGTYTPPGSLLGLAFDAAGGKRLAQATINNFLRSLRDCVQVHYAAN